MTTGLTKYDEAVRAVAEAKSVDEVLNILDVGERMEAAGRIAKDDQIERDGKAIRLRAKRALGEMMKAQKETVGLNRGNAGRGRSKKGGSAVDLPKDARPTLAQAGIGKHLADEARKEAAIPATNSRPRSLTSSPARSKRPAAKGDGRKRMSLKRAGFRTPVTTTS